MTQRVPGHIGDPLEAVDTPALVVDLDAFEANLDMLMASVAGRGVRVRCHAKTHKSPDVARAQIARGAIGQCCQKVSEAEALVDGGVADVLISNEVVGEAKLARLAALSARARIGVCVDDARQVAALARAVAQSPGARLEVYVEIDVGAARCGVAPGGPAVGLARAIAAAPGLAFAGLHAYQGAAQHVRGAAERRALIERAADAVRATRAALAQAGIDCPIVTGAGSGSYMYEIESGAWNEIQPGSYCFMDADYGRNEWVPPMPRYAQALFVLATVMSTPAPGRVVVDAGLKASSVDAGLPLVWQRPGLEYAKASDEHGVIEVAVGTAAPGLGERLLLVPGHCDPTINLYDWYVGVRAGCVEALWPVSARGALT